MKGRIKDIGFGLQGDMTVTLSLPRFHAEELKDLMEHEIEADIKKWRNKRSLSANAYAWVLITKIAQSMRPPLNKQEVYLMMLRRYGQGGQITIQTTQFDSVIRGFAYHEIIGTGIAKGKEYTHADVLVGSSNYNTKEMATLIEGIAEEARQLGIETLTPQEIARLEYA